MPIIDPILSELDHESRTTVRVLERVPGDQLDWTPHPKSMSLRKLAWHIANLPARVQVMLSRGSFDVANATPPQPPEDVSQMVETFRTNVAEIRTFLATLDDAALKETFTMTRGEETLMSMPKIAVIRSILLNHSYHHRGQLSVYLRLLDVPVPAIYGASADERM
jgi:uncharacterized damage-inducible protein DinB